MSNLLTTLNLSTNQLIYKQDQESIAAYIKQTDNLVQSAISAIHHMTLLNKLDSGQLQPSYIQTDITKLLLQAITRKRAKVLNINLKLNGARVYKSVDAYFLEIVFNELLNNSCRYRSSNVSVSISTHKEKTRIIVEDDGEGIESGELKDVFDPYYRIKKHRLRCNRAGLGLTTVQAITDKIEGKVKLKSSPSWGTKVEIVI